MHGQVRLRLKCAVRTQSIHLTAYSPLGSPDSADAMKRGADVPNVLENNAVVAIAKKLGKEPGQV